MSNISQSTTRWTLAALSAGLCLALVAPSQAEETAPTQKQTKVLETQWDMSLRLRLRGESSLNRTFQVEPGVLAYPKPDNLDLFTQQTHINIKATRGKLSAFVQLQQALVWGTTGGNTLTNAPIDVHQAWFQAKPSDMVALQAGRLKLAYGDQRVLGAVGWSQAGRAWDGLRAKLKPAKGLALDIFAAQYNEGSTGPNLANGGTYSNGLFDDDSWLGGLYFTIKKSRLTPALSVVDVYVIGETTFEAEEPDAETTTAQRRRLTSGARINGVWGQFGATAEGAYQTGSTCVFDPSGICGDTDRINIDAWFFDTEFTLSVSKGIKLLAGFGQASGDDPDTADTLEAYNHLYPTAHKWLGLMDIVGARSNVREIRGGFKGKFNALKLTLTGHDFTRLEPSEQRTGTEVDTILNYAFTKDLSILVGHGIFFPAAGATLDSTDPQGTAQWFVAQAQATF